MTSNLEVTPESLSRLLDYGRGKLKLTERTTNLKIIDSNYDTYKGFYRHSHNFPCPLVDKIPQKLQTLFQGQSYF